MNPQPIIDHKKAMRYAQHCGLSAARAEQLIRAHEARYRRARTWNCVAAAACSLIGLTAIYILAADAFGVLRSPAPSWLTISLTAGVCIGILATLASVICLLLPPRK